MMDKADRVPCCIPFCKRTAARAKHPGVVEIICYLHYRTGSKTLRSRLSRLRKRRERYHPERDVGKIARSYAIDWQIWSRLKNQIIERAMGI